MLASTGADAGPTAMGQRRDCGADDGERLPRQCHRTRLLAEGAAEG